MCPLQRRCTVLIPTIFEAPGPAWRATAARSPSRSPLWCAAPPLLGPGPGPAHVPAPHRPSFPLPHPPTAYVGIHTYVHLPPAGHALAQRRAACIHASACIPRASPMALALCASLARCLSVALPASACHMPPHFRTLSSAGGNHCTAPHICPHGQSSVQTAWPLLHTLIPSSLNFPRTSSTRPESARLASCWHMYLACACTHGVVLSALRHPKKQHALVTVLGAGLCLAQVSGPCPSVSQYPSNWVVSKAALQARGRQLCLHCAVRGAACTVTL